MDKGFIYKYVYAYQKCVVDGSLNKIIKNNNNKK